MKTLIYYLKNRKDINYHYGFAVKEGYVSDGLGWSARTYYYIKCQSYDGKED